MGDQDFKIPTWVDEAFLLKVLRWKFPTKADSVQVHNYHVEVGTNKGDGFASEMFRVVVDSSLGTFSLILKKPHENPDRFEKVNGLDLFNRENDFYLEFYPALREILESVDEFEEFAPEIFYVDRETDLLIMRDLRTEGFKTGDRFSRVSREHAEIILRKLAKMNAASLILNQKLNGSLEKNKVKIFDGAINEMVCNYIRVLSIDMKTWGSEYEAMIPKVERAVEHYKELATQNVESNSGLNMMIHADPWFNNMLLKSGDKPDGVFIDFQTCAWASPGIDLVYFTVTSLKEEEFDKREELFKVYHSTLERVLKKFNWERIPTYEDIVQEYKDKFFHALYSTIAKVITASDPSDHNLENIWSSPDEEILLKMQNPLVSRELRKTLKLLDLYGALDKKVA